MAMGRAAGRGQTRVSEGVASRDCGVSQCIKELSIKIHGEVLLGTSRNPVNCVISVVVLHSTQS